jgi:hypothetical protein
VKRDIGEVSQCCPKVREDLTDLQQELAKLKEEIKRMKGTQDPLAEAVGQLKGQLARVEAGQQSAVGRLQEAIAAGGSKVKDDLSSVQGELAKLKEEIKRMKITTKQFPPSMKKGKLRYDDCEETGDMYDIPDGIIAHLTRECGGNVHDRHVVEVTSGSFEKERNGANPHSGAFDNRADAAAKNAADMEADSYFYSAYRNKEENIPHTRNNWVCYHFKEKRIVPTHYTIRTYYSDPGHEHLKSWLVETSEDGKSWREAAREENNKQLNGERFTGKFAVTVGWACRFIRLVQIGKNHGGNDWLIMAAWEIFGSLFE